MIISENGIQIHSRSTHAAIRWLHPGNTPNRAFAPTSQCSFAKTWLNEPMRNFLRAREPFLGRCQRCEGWMWLGVEITIAYIERWHTGPVSIITQSLQVIRYSVLLNKSKPGWTWIDISHHDHVTETAGSEANLMWKITKIFKSSWIHNLSRNRGGSFDAF